MPNIKEIAKECNVSIATVSNILNGKAGASEVTRRQVLDKAKELNYIPNIMAKNLKQKSTKTIGIITEDLTVFNTPEIVDGIHDYLDQCGYTFLLGNMRLYKKYGNDFYLSEDYHDEVEAEIRMMEAKQVEGIIYICAHSRVTHCIPKTCPLPIVVVYGFSDHNDIPCIVYNDEKAAYDATNLLIQRGHTRIGLVAGMRQSIHCSERLLGYQRALYENQLLFNPKLLIYEDWTREKGYEAAELLFKENVTGIFAMNDEMAGGVYDYANEASLTIGADIALVGFDNRPICTAFRPALTTMALPLHEMGYSSADRIVRRIERREEYDEDMVYRIDCELKIRPSIG